MAGRVPSLRELKKKSNSLVYLKNAKLACVTNNYAEAYENFVLYFDSLNDPLDSPAAVQKIFTKLVCKMGIILEETCNIEELLKCYIQALNFFPDNYVILGNLGVYMVKNAEIDIARRYLERAVKVNKDYLPAEINLMQVKWHQIPRWHFSMLNDKRRNIAYEKAISTHVNEEPPGKCNLLVTEVFDVAFFGERALETIAHASTVLRTEEDYKIVPCQAKVYVTAIDSEKLHSKHRCTSPRSIELLNLHNLEITEQDSEPYDAENLSDFDVDYLTDTQEIFDIDFYDPDQILQILNENNTQRIHLTCQRAGTAHALAVWFDLGLTADARVTTDPSNDDRVTCWQQAVFHADRPVGVRPGDVLHVDVSMRNSRLEVALADMEVGESVRVSKEVVSFLNDEGLVESVVRLAERFEKADLTVVDYNVFPLLGFLLAKRGRTVFHSVKNECDRAFFERVLALNDIPKDKFVMTADELVLEPDERKCLFFFDAIGRDGLLDSSGFVMMGFDEKSVNIPQNVVANVQLIHSHYIDECNLVRDENVLDFKIAEFINDYSGYAHPNLENLEYMQHSDAVQFPLDRNGTATARVAVTRAGFVNALYVWYDVRLHQDVVFCTKDSTHYRKACFFLRRPVGVRVGESVAVKLELDGSYVKICLVEEGIGGRQYAGRFISPNP